MAVTLLPTTITVNLEHSLKVLTPMDVTLLPMIGLKDWVVACCRIRRVSFFTFTWSDLGLSKP